MPRPAGAAPRPGSAPPAPPSRPPQHAAPRPVEALPAEGGDGPAWLFLLAVVAGSVIAVHGLFTVPKGPQLWPWALGRAAGLMAFLLVTLTVLLGIWQSHPWSRAYAPRSIAFSHRVHILLTIFALCFVLVHATSLALDPYAGVGVLGALVPGASVYRPLPVALGVIAAYAGILTGGTAALGRWIGRRFWLPLHRWAGVVLVLGWFHGVLAGSDTPQLRGFYLVTGAAVLLLAGTRYVARSPSSSRAGGRAAAQPQAVPDAAPVPPGSAAAPAPVASMAAELERPGPPQPEAAAVTRGRRPLGGG